MDPRTKAFASGGIALSLALVIILSATFLGFAPTGAGTLKPNSAGALSIMLTDPPSTPSGVTAVFITYNDLRIHAVGFPSTSGWIGLDSQGTVEALGLANLTQTITSTDVPSGTYDAVAFNILSCQIEYQGKNFSATVHSSSLETPFVSSLEVSPSSVSTALVDLQSTVLNLGSGPSPQFLVNAAPKAVEVPSSQVQPQSRNVGSKSSLKSSNWYNNFTSVYEDHLTIGSVSLTPHSLSLVVNNPTSDSVAIRMVVISPAQAALHQSVMSPSLIGSTVFVVGQNGTLRLLQFGNPGPSVNDEVQTILGSPAFQLSVGTSATFSYTGTFKLSYGGSSGNGAPEGRYAVTIIGNQVLASTIVSLS